MHVHLAFVTRYWNQVFAARHLERVEQIMRDVYADFGCVLAESAARHVYADQPHLADEFRELAGVTPAEYLRSRVDGPNHLRFPSGALEPSAQVAPTLERRPAPRHYGAGLSGGA